MDQSDLGSGKKENYSNVGHLMPRDVPKGWADGGGYYPLELQLRHDSVYRRRFGLLDDQDAGKSKDNYKKGERGGNVLKLSGKGKMGNKTGMHMRKREDSNTPAGY